MHDARTGCDTTDRHEAAKFARAEYWRSADDLEKTPEFRALMARGSEFLGSDWAILCGERAPQRMLWMRIR